ncbi:MAG TPA: glycosyltransferase [Gammaproteobacteria bacterium]|jgi:hopene-associated glycosyltransferase HpnB
MSWLLMASALLWACVLLLPWRPCAVRESLAADAGAPDEMSDVVALVPARNEAESIARTLAALSGQGRHLKIVVVDDQSTDGTVEAINSAGLPDLVLIRGEALPAGWTGKVWAQAQGEKELDRPLTLLLDADVELAPGLLTALKRKMRDQRAGLASLMVELPMAGFWERVLIPAFVYFFKLLYPFALANAPHSRVAAAAGGCVLMETRRLQKIGGFASLRGELIDDCTLARLVKNDGARIWVGLTRDARGLRRYPRLSDIWNMVARTAFTQLRLSGALLAVCTLLMALAFVAPVTGLAAGGSAVFAAIALGAMMLSYFPTIRYYRLHPVWVLALPLAGVLFLAMTWSSAFRHWRGEGVSWRGRAYDPRGGGAGVRVR